MDLNEIYCSCIGGRTDTCYSTKTKVCSGPKWPQDGELNPLITKNNGGMTMVEAEAVLAIVEGKDSQHIHSAMEAIDHAEGKTYMMHRWPPRGSQVVRDAILAIGLDRNQLSMIASRRDMWDSIQSRARAAGTTDAQAIIRALTDEEWGDRSR